MYCMCGHVELERGRAWGRGEASGLWEMGQLIFNMGIEWSKV